MLWIIYYRNCVKNAKPAQQETRVSLLHVGALTELLYYQTRPLSRQLSLASFFSQISSIVLAFLGNYGIFVKLIWKKFQGAEYL